MSDIDKVLEERGRTHGEYSEHARLTQETLGVWESGRNWKGLSNIQKETLHMISHKVGRILEGDPNEPDHWRDICGYSRLVEQRLLPPIQEVATVPLEDSNKHADRVIGFPYYATEEEVHGLPVSRQRMWNMRSSGYVLAETISRHAINIDLDPDWYVLAGDYFIIDRRNVVTDLEHLPGYTSNPEHPYHYLYEFNEKKKVFEMKPEYVGAWT